VHVHFLPKPIWTGAAIGSVTNMSARLCGEAGPWQILATQRVLSEAGEGVRSDLVGDLQLRGFSKPVRAFDVLGLDGASATPGVRS